MALHLFLRFFHKAAEIASADIGLHDDAPLCAFTRHHFWSALDAERRDLIQPDLLLSGRLQQQIAHRIQVVPVRRRQSHGNRETALSLDHLGNAMAACRGVDHLLNIGHVQAVARECRPIDLNAQFRHSGQHFRLRIGGARDGLQDLERFTAMRSRTSGSSPKIFTATSALMPETTSSSRMAIGCVKLYSTPGIR